MSFSTTNPWVQYAGNDSTTEFAFNHKIHDQGDVVVLLTVGATNVTTIQTITTHYTVADVAEDAHDATTPTITMLTPPATGETLTIYRQVDLIMNTNFGTNKFWQSLSAEKQNELSMMATQWIYLLVSRTFIGSLASDPVTTTAEEILAAIGILPISSLPAKETPIDADVVRLGDSEYSGADKKVTLTNLWTNYIAPLVVGADTDAIHDNVDGEINAISAKTPVVAGDLLLIEDSAASNAKKKVLLSALSAYILLAPQLGGNLNTNGNDILFDTGNGIKDSNSLYQLIFTLVASAVNQITITNAATGNSPKIAATGSNSDIDLGLAGKGTGSIKALSNIDANDKDILNAKTVTFTPVITTTPGATQTIDWSAGIKQKITLDANCTFTFTDPSEWVNLIIVIVQGGSGSYTITWPANVKWPSGTAPTLSTAIGSIDVVAFLYNSTDDEYYGQEGLDFQ